MRLRQIFLMLALLLTSCIISFSLFAQAPTAGLVAYFKLNGNTTNSVGGPITATAIGTSYTTNNSGQANNAMQFPGLVTSYVDITDGGNLDFTGNFTISFGFFFNGTATGGLIDNCLNYGGYGVWLWSTTSGIWNIQFNWKNNSVGSSAATAFTLNQWHTVTVVNNSGTMSVYIDGAFRLSGPAGTMTPTYPINALMGAFGYSGFSPPRYNPLLGKMDEVRFYNRALTPAEIAILSPITLPLKLDNFTASKQSSSIVLNWETLSEYNTRSFEIERSSDGTQFSKIGETPAQGQSGAKKAYAFTDRSPQSGTNFYRLKLIDNDGAFTYSRIIAVKNELVTGLQFFPNPVKDVLQIQLPSLQTDQAFVSVVDASGRNIFKKSFNLNAGTNAISLPLYELATGSYYLVVKTSSGQQSKAFLKD